MKYLSSFLLAAALLCAGPLIGATTSLSSTTNIVPGDKGFVIAGTAAVASTTVGTAGTGYTSAPTVAFTGGSGSVQATGTATLKVVGSITITAGGTGYTAGDVLTIVGGTKSTAATVTVSTVSSGVITAATLTNAGVYTVPVTTTGAATTGGTGTGATVTVGYGVGTVVLVTNGSGYLTAPSIGFSGGAGSSAAATATLGSFAVSASFNTIIPITDSIIASITFAPRAAAGRPDYSGDSGIIGKTLTAGKSYTVFGDAITLTSGQAFLLLR